MATTLIFLMRNVFVADLCHSCATSWCSAASSFLVFFSSKYTLVTWQTFEFYTLVNKIEFDINVINNEVVLMVLFNLFDFLILLTLTLISCVSPDNQTSQDDSKSARVLSPTSSASSARTKGLPACQPFLLEHPEICTWRATAVCFMPLWLEQLVHQNRSCIPAVA